MRNESSALAAKLAEANREGLSCNGYSYLFEAIICVLEGESSDLANAGRLLPDWNRENITGGEAEIIEARAKAIVAKSPDAQILLGRLERTIPKIAAFLTDVNGKDLSRIGRDYLQVCILLVMRGERSKWAGEGRLMQDWIQICDDEAMRLEARAKQYVAEHEAIARV